MQMGRVKEDEAERVQLFVRRIVLQGRPKHVLVFHFRFRGKVDEMNDARQLDAEKAARHAAYVEKNCFDRQGQGHFDIGVVGPVGALFRLGLENAFAARTGHGIFAPISTGQLQGIGRSGAGRVAAEFAAHHVDAQRLAFRHG